MRNLLLRLLADTDSRAYLRDNRDAAFEYIGRINYALDQKRADPSLESASRKHYEETTQAL